MNWEKIFDTLALAAIFTGVGAFLQAHKTFKLWEKYARNPKTFTDNPVKDFVDFGKGLIKL